MKALKGLMIAALALSLGACQMQTSTLNQRVDQANFLLTDKDEDFAC